MTKSDKGGNKKVENKVKTILSLVLCIEYLTEKNQSLLELGHVIEVA